MKIVVIIEANFHPSQDYKDQMKRSVEHIVKSYSIIASTFKCLSCESTINNPDGKGNTPLHLFLRKEYYNDIYCDGFFFDYTEISKVYYKLLQHLLHLGASLHTCNGNREYPIHLACQYQDLQTIQISGAAGMLQRTSNGDNIFHKACRNPEVTIEVIEYLVHQAGTTGLINLFNEVNDNGDLPLHILCMICFDERIFKFMVDDKAIKCDITSQNNEGDTPLHLFLKRGYFLDQNVLLHNDVVLTLPNNCGETPLDLIVQKSRFNLAKEIVSFHSSSPSKLKNILHQASEEFLVLLFLHDKDMVRTLLNLRIDPLPLYKAHRNFFQNQLKPPQFPINMLFIGDPLTGKTTLVNSLQKEAGLNINEEPDRTAGIISKDFKSKKYGQVTTYDFAGQREFYASHEAVMQSIIQKSPPIVLILVRLGTPIKKIEKQIVYWSNFIRSRLKSLSDKAHLIIICSHADLVTDAGKLTEQIHKNTTTSIFELAGVLSMDCRESKGTAIENLVSTLTRSSKTLRTKGVLKFNAHCLFVFLSQHLKNDVAITISNLFQFKIKHTSEKIQSILPNTIEELMELCEELFLNGQILLIKDDVIPQRSWIILDKQVLLNEVSGKIFAPPGFSIHDEKLSSTGVVSFSRIKELFPKYDPNMVFAFLCSIEYCYEIRDQVFMNYIASKSKSINLPLSEKYFFFPSLVTTERPPIDWVNESSDKSHQFGWVLKCKHLDHFFTPNFIQRLILRLIFGLTKIKPMTNNSACEIGSISDIWKSGLFWLDGNGIDTVVDVVDTSSKVVVFMRCDPGNELKMLQHRSSLMKSIREIKEDLCSLILTDEYFVHSSYIRECFSTILINDQYLVPMSDICETLNANEMYVVTKYLPFRRKPEEFILFDPYAHICSCLIHPILNEDSKISDKFLYALMEHLDKKFDLFAKLLKSSSISLSRLDRDPHKFVHLFKLWLERNTGTFRYLKRLFDSISVFTGQTH